MFIRTGIIFGLNGQNLSCGALLAISIAWENCFDDSSWKNLKLFYLESEKKHPDIMSSCSFTDSKSLRIILFLVRLQYRHEGFLRDIQLP